MFCLVKKQKIKKIIPKLKSLLFLLKDYINNPEKKQKIFALKFIVFGINRVSQYYFSEMFKILYNQNELEACSFLEFQKVFKPRTWSVFSIDKIKIEKHVLTLEDDCLLDFFMYCATLNRNSKMYYGHLTARKMIGWIEWRITQLRNLIFDSENISQSELLEAYNKHLQILAFLWFYRSLFLSSLFYGNFTIQPSIFTLEFIYINFLIYQYVKLLQKFFQDFSH